MTSRTWIAWALDWADGRHQATVAGSAWTVASLTTNSEPEAKLDPDAMVVVHDATRAGDVWKTEEACVGTCRQHVPKCADGSSVRANFRFK